MATKQEVVAFISENYKHEVLDGPVFKLTVPLEPGRQHSVYAAVTDGEVQVTAPVAWQNKISADQILDANESMFGIVKIAGAFGLKHNVLIADIDESELTSAFVLLAAYADVLEKSLGFADQF